VSDPKAKIISYKDIPKIREKARRLGKKIIFLTGFFDLYHVGHAAMLAWANSQGDILFIGLGPDAAAKAWKGEGRPIYNEADRAYVLACHQSVDYVVILREPIRSDKINFRKAFRLISPHIFLAVSTDPGGMQAERRKMTKEIGAKFKIFSPFPHKRRKKPSTSETLIKIRRYD